MKFVTTSGSVYELDLTGRRIRRLRGEGATTPRMGEDGKWMDYVAVTFPSEGSRILVTWRWTEEGVAQCTATSPISRIDETTEEDRVFLTQMALSLQQSQGAC